MVQYNYRFFIKFGKLEHLKNLQKNGHIYLNTLKKFRTLPEETLIGDKYEGLQYLKQIRNLSITGEVNGGKFGFTAKKAIGYPNERIEGNIYCLYGGYEELLETYLKGNTGQIPLEGDFQDYSHFALINNPKEFIRRIGVFLDQAGLEYKCAPVNYVDFEVYEGKLNQFCKRIKYKGQNEFRVFVYRKTDGPLQFEIGDLTDICVIGKTELHQHLRFKIL